MIEFYAFARESDLPEEDERRAFQIAIPQDKVLRFSTGNLSIPAGTTINDQTSGATAVTADVPVVQSGSYTAGTAAGYIPLTSWTGTWGVNNNVRVGTTVRAKVTRGPVLSPAYTADEMRWRALPDNLPTATATRSMFEVALLGASGENKRIWQTTSNVDPNGTEVAPQLRYPTETFDNPQFTYTLVPGGVRANLSAVGLIPDLTVPGDPGTEVWIPSNKVEFPLHKGFYYGGDTIQEIQYMNEVLWIHPAPQLVGSASQATLAIPQPNTPSVYGNGDYLVALAYHAVAAAFGNPTPTFWGEAIPGGATGQGQGLALIAGRAAAANVTLGSFTGTAGKIIACSYRGVHTSSPYVVGAASMNAAANSCAIPGMTLPDTGFDNWRILIWACNTGNANFTPPTGFRFLTSGGATTVRVSLFESIDPVRTFAGLSVGMSASIASAGVAMALRLA